MDNLQNGEVVIYTSADGNIKLDVKYDSDSLWLSQYQLEELFQTDRTSILRHIRNIIKTGELDADSTCAKFAQVHSEGKRIIKRNILYYNLDMIISVGYRVKSKTATKFRIWATNILKNYIRDGFAVNSEFLIGKQKQINTLRDIISIAQRGFVSECVDIEKVKSLNSLLERYSKGLDLLDDYDHKRLDAVGKSVRLAVKIGISEFQSVIDEMKKSFPNGLFGNQKDNGFKSSVSQIYQTVGGQDCYPSIEEKASMLLYLIVKNHSFSDGNKRIAAACFIYFLEKNGILFSSASAPRIDNDTLFALTVLIAESNPTEMESVKRVTISILNRA